MVHLLKIVFFTLLFFASSAQAESRHPTQLMCMARNIYFEAGSEPFEGKLAVGQVVLNRMNHPNFPKNVCDVVFQRNQKTCQFSWVCEGKGNVNEKSIHWRDSLDAAKFVLTYEYVHDKLNKDVLFFKTRTSPFPWTKYFTKVATIGNHDFYMRKSRNNANKG